jgi:glycerol uptake facilitator protein
VEIEQTVAATVTEIEPARTAGVHKAAGAGVGKVCLAECVGTFVLILFGCGAVHTAVLAGAQSGIWQVAIVWGVAIMLAIYMVGAISGAHINPAVTITFAVSGRLPWRMVVPYVAAQVAGAFLAAAALFTMFEPYLGALEQEKQVLRGQPGSEITAMCYGEYFPSPAPLASAAGRYSPDAHRRLNALVSGSTAFFAEVLGTMLLAMVIFAVSDDRNRVRPPHGLAAVLIGLTVAGLISFIAPLTQACFNPARDFGPRLFAYLAGWGKIALPGPRGLGFLTVYIVAPIVGAVAGAGFYNIMLRRRGAETEDQVTVWPPDAMCKGRGNGKREKGKGGIAMAARGHNHIGLPFPPPLPFSLIARAVNSFG